MPPFPLEGGLPLALTRGAADTALLAQFGALFALAWLAPPFLPDRNAPAARRLTRLAFLLLLAAALLTLAWLAAETQDMAGSLTALPLLLQQTLYGHLVLTRLALLGLAALALAFHHPWPGTLFAAAALATQAGHDHAWAMYDGPSLLLLSTIAHLLAAGAWLGGLPPLGILIATLPAPQAAQAARRYAHLGTACVAILTVTALFQASTLIGAPAHLLDTAYGLVASAKIALFAALLALAALNRFRLTPALATPALATPALATPAPPRRALLRSLTLETALGLCVILAAGMLTSLPPSMHEPPMHEPPMHEPP